MIYKHSQRMYVKNFSFAAAPPEKHTPPPPPHPHLSLLIRLPPEFQQFFSPQLLIKKKNQTPLQLKRGHCKTQHCTQSFFAHTGIYIYGIYQSGSEGHPLWLGLMLKNPLEITTTRLPKINFSTWQLFLKTLPQKCWPQYLVNYTGNTDGTCTYLGNYTDGTK